MAHQRGDPSWTDNTDCCFFWRSRGAHRGTEAQEPKKPIMRASAKARSGGWRGSSGPALRQRSVQGQSRRSHPAPNSNRQPSKGLRRRRMRERYPPGPWPASPCKAVADQPIRAATATSASALQAPRLRQAICQRRAVSASRVLAMAMARGLLLCLFIGAILQIAVEENNAVSWRQSGPTSCHIQRRMPASNQNDYGTLTIAKLWRKACANFCRSRNLVAVHQSG